MTSRVEYGKNINELMEIIAYKFEDETLLKQALTHVSAIDKHLQSNERLEFLGDAILELIVSEQLYRNMPEANEGEMTRLRASIVCEEGLYAAAKQIDLGDYLTLGMGEARSGGREKASILSDAFEALLSAVYLDGGYKEARRVAIQALYQRIREVQKREGNFDYKTALQEYLQKNGSIEINYEIIDSKGPDHERMFKAQVSVAGEAKGEGWGKSKKAAEQAAAQEYLQKLGEI